MNWKLILHGTALVLILICGFMLFPLFVALIYKEWDCAIYFSLTISGGLLFFFLLFLLTHSKKEHRFRTRDGFLMVTLCWLLIAFFGSIPYYISRSIPSFTDAFFETMSGFTTTGATVLADVEELSRSMLFWRALTHWIGGMGIVVLTVAVAPLLGVSGLNLVKAEAPGPSVEKISAKINSTAKILWLIYIGLTFLETLFLLLGKLSFYDALTHSFSTIATGGFSSYNSSVSAFKSRYVEWVIFVFMVLSGINFSLHFRLITGKVRELIKNGEFRLYIAILFFATLIITLNLVLSKMETLPSALRLSAFQVSSIMTTTGFSTADYTLWPGLSQVVIFLLFFVGGCAGSTGGGVKVIRLITLFKLAIYQLKSLIYPQGVFTIKNGKEIVPSKMIYSTGGFYFLYLSFALGLTLFVSAFGNDLLTSLTTSLSMIGNVGPAFGAASPANTLSEFSPAIKWAFSFAMMVGRLEIYTVLVLFLPHFWKD